MKKSAPAPKKVDPLLEVVADQTARTCLHPNVKFERYGAVIRCIDCPKRWFVCMNDEFDLPDYLYGNQQIGDNETRHSRFEEPRTQPKAAPKKPSKTK